MKRLGRYRWGPPLVVELASFVVAFAIFAGAGGAYAALSGNTGRPIWWVLLPAALVVAVVLPLVRPSIAAVVERMAHGRQAEGYRMMSELMTRMAATLEVDEVLPRLAETAARSVHADRGEVSVWLADGRQWRRTWTPGLGDDPAGAADGARDQAWDALRTPERAVAAGDSPAGQLGAAGTAASNTAASNTPASRPAASSTAASKAIDPWADIEHAGSGGVMVEVQHQGDIVGELGVGVAGPELSAADQRALNDLAAPAGVALATVRLTVELRRRVAEVAEQTRELQASRRRLVNARRDEQQRTWGRLSATVIPSISAISESLDEFRSVIKDGQRGDRHLEAARQEATEALEALREVARGIFPALLSDSGLEVALQAWADRRSPGRQVIVEGDLSPLHRWPAAEAALYYACTSAIEETAGATPSTAAGAGPEDAGGPGSAKPAGAGPTDAGETDPAKTPGPFAADPAGAGPGKPAGAAAAQRRRPGPPPVVLTTDGVAATATVALPAGLEEGTQRAIRDRLEALGGSLRIGAPSGPVEGGAPPAEPAPDGALTHDSATSAASAKGSASDSTSAEGTVTSQMTRPVVLVATVPVDPP